MMLTDIPKKTKKEEEREQNRKAIYHYILNNNFISKKEISNRFQLSLPTVNSHIQSLIEDGFIFAEGVSRKTGGRNAQTYCALLQKKVAFGIELTSNHVSIVILDLRGTIIDYLHIRQAFTMEDWYLRNLGDLVLSMKNKNQLSDDQILGVGIVIPGLVSEDNHVIEVCPILGITGTTSDAFSKYISYPLSLHNDCNAACFFEMWKEPLMDDCFFILVGPYIGGSVIINKTLYKGESFRSGEIGHTTLIPDGLPCYCGKKGCFNAYCTINNLTKYSNGSLEEFFSHLKLKEEPYISVWNHYLNNLSIGLNNIRMLFNCKIIVGGYLGTYIGDYMEDLKRLVVERDTFDANADFLHYSEFKYETIASGAALMYIDEYLKTV